MQDRTTHDHLNWKNGGGAAAHPEAERRLHDPRGGMREIEERDADPEFGD